MFLFIRWIINESQIPACLVKYDSAPGTFTEGRQREQNWLSQSDYTSSIMQQEKKRTSFQGEMDLCTNEPQFVFLFITNLKETQKN